MIYPQEMSTFIKEAAMTKRVSNRVSPIFKKLRQIIEFMLPEIDSRGDFVSLGLLVHFIFCYLDEPKKIQLEGIPRQKIRNLKTKVSSLFGNNLSRISGVPPPSGVQPPKRNSFCLYLYPPLNKGFYR